MSKSIKFKALAIFTIFVMGGFCAKAQLENLEQSLFLNLNCPMAQFNDKLLGANYTPMLKQRMGTGAMVGFGAGYRASYHFDIGYGEVSPYLNVDFQWNALKGDYRDQFTQAKCTAANYFNIPIYLGINYRYQLTDIFTPFAEFGLGADMLLITKETSGNNYGNVNIRYKPTTSFAWQIGAGCYFGPHVSASLHYQGYGKHVIDYTNGSADDLAPYVDPGTTVGPGMVTSSVEMDEVVQRNIGMFSLRIGFHF